MGVEFVLWVFGGYKGMKVIKGRERGRKKLGREKADAAFSEEE